MTTGFHQIVASDVDRDTLSLELWDGKEQIAEIAYSDTTHEMTVSIWRQDVPLKVIEEMIDHAKHRLPPTCR